MARKERAVRKGNAAPRKKPPAGAISRLRKPADLTLDAWQIELRRQHAAESPLRVARTEAVPEHGEYRVANPVTGKTYRVALRGWQPGENFCSCPDFAVNTLGTCKHIEAALARLRKNRAARRALDGGIRPPFSEIYLHYGPRREVRFRPGTDCPAGLRRHVNRCFARDGGLRSGADVRLAGLVRAGALRGHEIRFYDDARLFLAHARDRRALAARVDRLFPRGDGNLEQLLSIPLYPYQQKGALFAARSGRCLIADEMGLGKTVQAIAAAEILGRLGLVERALIVCPTSLKHQWQREITRFSRRSCLVVEGLLPERHRGYAADSFFKVTNYDVVHRDLERIAAWQPDLVILDEAQRIKNWRTRTARAVKQLPSEYAFVLTGTPLENRLEELYSIVEFVDRHHLGPMFRFLAEHQHLDENGRVVGYRNLREVAKTLEPILIRRRKAEVLSELPARLEKTFFTAMTDPQWSHHEENREIVARIVAKWKRHGFLSESDQRRLMIALQRMRMSCDSTHLLDPATDHGTKIDELEVLLTDLLEDPGTKVVIFSQWRRMLDLAARRMERRKLGHVLFHGSISGRSRRAAVDRFREDPACRLFLSTDAGGVGLNLQHASVVVNLDQPWNPAVLEQRTGRVHRLGQRQPVRVIHLVAQGTIEEGMLALLAFKRSMFGGVLDAGDDEVLLGGTRLTRFMETVERATTAIPAPPPPAEAGESGGREDVADAERPRCAAAAASEPGAPDASASAWGELLEAGASFLRKLERTVVADSIDSPRRAGAAGKAGGLEALIRRDDATGRAYLTFPVPAPETLRRIGEILSEVARAVGGKAGPAT